MSLTQYDKQKYVTGCRRLELGVWGYPESLFYKIHLTTKMGEDNSAKNFSKDFRKLTRWMKNKGVDLEYCGALGYTPQNNLIHGHFIFRIKGGFLKLYDGAVKDDTVEWYDDQGDRHSAHVDGNRRALGDAWQKYHGAFVVQIGNFKTGNEIIKYITSHVMKDYMNYDGEDRLRFIKSKRWDWRCKNGLVKEFRQWWGSTTGTSYLSEYGGFQLLKEFQKKMCEGGNFKVINEGGEIHVKNFEAIFGVYPDTKVKIFKEGEGIIWKELIPEQQLR